MHEAFFPRLHADNDAIALTEAEQRYSYSELHARVNLCARGLIGEHDSLAEERVAFLMPASLDYATVLLAVWRAGGIAVPLNVASATRELEHYLGCAGVHRLVANTEYQSPALRDLCAAMDVELVTVEALLIEGSEPLPSPTSTDRALMVFTSGTTNKPKGVISTHGIVRAQIETLLEAWAWSDSDSIPLFLPLHHVHGIINVLCCALWAGASVDLYPKLDLPTLTDRVSADRYTVFMAVPTIYVKLIQHIESLDVDQRTRIGNGFANMRLNVSGSAACPVKVFDEWRELTGQTLLERYGMTEIGMALSNPYEGERRAGFVGQPLPGVTVQLFDDADRPIDGEGVPGEIRIKGSNVFLEYWGNEKATRESFVDWWFCTGDVAVIEEGYYRIMGRSSIDIIKSGGYKLSALEIEGVLLNHPAIAEVAVIGIDDETWGEAVLAIAVLKAGAILDYDALKSWCKDKISDYKIPKALKLVDALPRNAMGKVTKPELKAGLS
jgi:malonyl-CoA/methylmalonyl-CoA synthetase